MATQGGEFYRNLGVKRIINAASWITVHGGSIMPPAVVQAMDDASRWFVDMHELNDKAGEVIARLTGAEAGLVTAGSAAGMVLEAAACMAGSDPARIWRLPDTTGMKSEIVIHRAHLCLHATAGEAAGRETHAGRVVRLNGAPESVVYVDRAGLVDIVVYVQRGDKAIGAARGFHQDIVYQ